MQFLPPAFLSNVYVYFVAVIVVLILEMSLFNLMNPYRTCDLSTKKNAFKLLFKLFSMKLRKKNRKSFIIKTFKRFFFCAQQLS